MKKFLNLFLIFSLLVVPTAAFAQSDDFIDDELDIPRGIGEVDEIDDEITTTDDIVFEDSLQEDEVLITVQETTATTEVSTGFDINSLTEYLPYILIVGSVILLFSIVGILLSKKGDSPEVTKEEIKEETATPETPPMQENTVTETPTPVVQDMVNEQPTVTPVEEPVVEEVPPTMITPEVTTPEVTPQPEPVSTTTNEEQDLQEILQKESSMQAGQAPSVETPVTPEIQEQPVEIPTPQMPETPPTPVVEEQIDSVQPFVTETPPVQQIDDLQQVINQEVQQMNNNTAPQVEPVAPATPPLQEEVTDEDLPPVPPTM